MHITAAVFKNEHGWRRLVAVVAILVLIVCALRAIHKPTDGDFKLHWEFGRRFLTGEFLYSNGLDVPYPPFWALAHAPAALLPMPVAKALLFPLGVAALVLLLKTLRRLAAATRAFAVDSRRAFWVAAIALFLAAHYLIRDMAELGINTALVTLSWLGIYLWSQRRDLAGGVSLGLAIALKCTPAIFVAYFLWKRQWRIFAASGVAAVLFTLAPMLWQGRVSYSDHMMTWFASAWKGFGNSNPTVGVLGAEPLQNKALRPALARYLTVLPAGHPGRLVHPLYFNGLNLSPNLASWIIRIVLLALLATLMWWSRRPVHVCNDPRLVWELAAVSIVMLLFSPITWGQHCVGVLPACYFISALLIARGGLPPWMMVLLGIYVVFVLLLSRDLVGRDLALLLGSYHVETFSILGLLAVVMGCSRLTDSGQAERLPYNGVDGSPEEKLARASVL